MTTGIPGHVTRVRVDAEGPDLMACAAALDKATEFVLQRRYVTRTIAKILAPPDVTVSSSLGGALEFEALFDGESHRFVEDVYESKERNGVVCFVGRRVLALDTEAMDEGGLLRWSPMDGVPQVAVVPLALEVFGVTRAIAVPRSARATDIIDAVAGTSWWPLQSAEDDAAVRYALKGYLGGDVVVLYEGPVPSRVPGVTVGSLPPGGRMQPIMLSSHTLEEIEQMQPLYLLHSDGEPQPIVTGTGMPMTLCVPPLEERQGDGVAFEAIVCGQPTNVWVDPTANVWRAAEIAAKARGITIGTGWEVRDFHGSIVANPTTAAKVTDFIDVMPLYVSPRAGSGG